MIFWTKFRLSNIWSLLVVSKNFICLIPGSVVTINQYRGEVPPICGFSGYCTAVYTFANVHTPVLSKFTHIFTVLCKLWLMYTQLYWATLRTAVLAQSKCTHSWATIHTVLISVLYRPDLSSWIDWDGHHTWCRGARPMLPWACLPGRRPGPPPQGYA